MIPIQKIISLNLDKPINKNGMKTIIIFLFAVTVIYSQQKEYFRVYAEVRSERVFSKILEETYLYDVFPLKFQMVVNTGGREPFVVIGAYNSPDVELDPEAYRYDWTFFTARVRDGILKLKNKIPLR
jgi:hypothetical protein